MENARLFFFGGERGGVGTSGFAAKVEDVGAFLEHPEGLGDGAFGGVLGRVVEAAVGEGVGRDIEDAHDQSALAKNESASAKMPVVMGAGSEGHGVILGQLMVVSCQLSWILTAGARLRG